MSYAYVPFDPGCKICIEDRGLGEKYLQVRAENGTTTHVRLTPDMMRMMGYHGALAYKEATGNDCLMPDPVYVYQEDLFTAAPPRPRMRTRTAPPPAPVLQTPRVRTRGRLL